MKKRILVNRGKRMRLITALVVLFNAFAGTSASPWSGNSWGDISRCEINRTASNYIDYVWIPRSSFYDWEYGSTWFWWSHARHRGVAYSQNNPQED